MLTDEEKDNVTKIAEETTIAYQTALQMTHNSTLAINISYLAIAVLLQTERNDTRSREQTANTNLWSIFAGMPTKPKNNDPDDDE